MEWATPLLPASPLLAEKHVLVVWSYKWHANNAGTEPRVSTLNKEWHTATSL